MLLVDSNFDTKMILVSSKMSCLMSKLLAELRKFQLLPNLPQILPIPTFDQSFRQSIQLFPIDESFSISNLLNTADLIALALFDDADEL